MPPFLIPSQFALLCVRKKDVDVSLAASSLSLKVWPLCVSAEFRNCVACVFPPRGKHFTLGKQDTVVP